MLNNTLMVYVYINYHTKNNEKKKSIQSKWEENVIGNNERLLEQIATRAEQFWNDQIATWAEQFWIRLLSEQKKGTNMVFLTLSHLHQSSADNFEEIYAKF